MIKGYKIRIYPNKEQKVLIERHIGSCRFIWNYMLALQNENYKNGGKYISKFSMANLLTPLKKKEEYVWLNEVSNASLNRIVFDLNERFQLYFNKQINHPKFKSKKTSKKSYPVRCDRFYFKDSKHIHIEKIGFLKTKTDFQIPIGKEKFKNVRLSKELNKYFISFGLECENQANKLNDYNMGIDLGIKNLAVISYGDECLVFHNINKSKKMKNLENKMKRLQRNIARKYEANNFQKTNNVLKQEEKLRKIYKRISDIRKNYIHQVTHHIVTLLPKKIIIEDLNVKGMIKNRHLSKAIMEQCFYTFARFLEYKCEKYGIEFIKANRFYPSSKTCSKCGHIKKDLKLSDRTYKCEECNFSIDRDLNAAINLKNYVA